MNASNIIIESCVETLAAALKAEENGATQLELCSRLDLEGLTPDPDLVKAIINVVSIPVKVMIRNRSGDFCYDQSDKAQIKADIDRMIISGAKHFVYGSIKEDKLDIPDIAEVVRYIRSKNPVFHSFTIHKVIDYVADPLQNIEALKSISKQYEGIAFYVLSSGRAQSALDGAGLINKMVDVAGSDLTIISAGGIKADNLARLRQKTEAKAFHGKLIVPIT